LLILDEPTSNLDFYSRGNIWNVITNIAKKKSKKLSVLVSTQHIEEAERLCDRILIIKDGKE
jgi:ABC-2 type transport system ATP-binding protein